MLMTRNLKAKKMLYVFLFGCLARFMYEHMKKYDNKRPNEYEHLETKCISCKPPICPLCSPAKIVLPKNEENSESYKPKGMYEITRWFYFDKDHVYDIINEEPKIAIKGFWKEVIKAAIAIGMNYVKSNNILDRSWILEKLEDGYMRIDSARGTDFMLDLLLKSTRANITYYKLFRVHLVHPFNQIQQAKLQSIKKQSKERITIIIHFSKNSRFVEDLLKNFNNTIKNNNVQLVAVFDSSSSNGKQAKDNILRAKQRFPHLNIKVIENTISYLNAIANTAKSAPNDVIITIQEDMEITEGFLHHCRALCDQYNQVYFPIVFAKFDADTIERGMPPGKPKHIDKMDHNRYTGSWEHSERKSVCAHGRNWIKVLGRANFRYIKQQNVEDWLYSRFALNGLRVVTAVEPHLFVVNRKKQCTHLKPFPNDLKQCIKAKRMHHGSKIALGILYITETMSKKVIT